MKTLFRFFAVFCAAVAMILSFSSRSKDSVTVKIGSYSDNMTFALESVSATKAVLVDSEVESDGTSWKEEYVFKELPRNDLKTDPKQ